MSTLTDSFYDQLLEDTRFLKADRRLDTELVDKLILQLNRIYPQILTDKEASKVSFIFHGEIKNKQTNKHLTMVLSGHGS